VVATTKTRVTESLKRAQANTICLYLNAKRYHWYTYGPLFRDLHLLFDEIAMVSRDQIDPFGERVRILGGDPLSAPDEIKSACTVTVSSTKEPVMTMLHEALDNENKFIDEMRQGVRVATEEDDPGSIDLFTRSIADHEKYAWFLSETVRRGDGVVT
jgi:starvation-inducible DNA-binding protein